MGEFDRWTNIHSDLLVEISKQFYSYDDYFRFRLVCKEWSLKLPKIPNHKRNPWLVLPDIGEPAETSILEEREIYHIKMSKMEDKFIRGSCYGWLIYVMIYDGTLRMLNPFTNIYFDLPPISTFPDVIGYRPKASEEYTLLSPRDDQIYTLEATQLYKYEVWKVVISSSPDNHHDDFMAVAIYGCCGRLAFYKLHYRRWIDIPTTEIEPDFQDVIFFQKKIYAIDYYARLYEFDTKTEPLSGGIIEAVSPPSLLETRYSASMNKYLIGCTDGSLLLLVRYIDYHQLNDNLEAEEDIRQDSYNFHIFSFDKDAKEWSRKYRLGNYALMIGYNFSMCMLAHTSPNGKGNHIYYTDNQVENHSADIATYQDIGVLNLEDRSDKKLLLQDVKFLCPPVWLLF